MNRLALVAVLLVAGCGGEDQPAAADRERPVPVDEFNASHPDGVATPAELGALFVAGDSNARTTTIVVDRPGEAGPEATVTVTLDGLLDDSVRSVRYRLEVELREGAWRLRSASWAQRCALDRGHQDFTPEDCA